MAKIKQIGMAAGTFSVALGIGFVMQNGDALAARFGADTAAEQPAPFAETVEVDAAADVIDPMVMPFEEPIVVAQAGVASPKAPDLATPNPVIESAVVLPEAAKVPPQPQAPIQLAALDPEEMPEIETDAIAAVEVDCVPVMSATASTAATVALSVSAPCHTSAPFTVHHQGMMFTAMTDASGAADMNVPALAEVAVMIAAFADGDGAVSTVAIPDFANYDRAVLQWQGETSVMLSAYEGNANFGDDAHIHAGNPGDMARLATAEGGYLVKLGNASAPDPLMAEIYTFPSGMIGVTPDVMLVAEAEITAGNCGQELNAQSIQVSPTGATSALDLTMIMPDCDAVGDFLILQNMFEDLTIASR
ncbi:hypothetical protein L0664_10200 [Octadecabacter sp. G9-8]|uniref:CHRD domain-containing protein n=1 Tax=Octadecabacter dasysiphoniae TaxID=2909341 RepID=A0ABS9CVY4_9RHOB|nr:hypothetical protein [Octadecabacter dasysiphoniae]MCF2871433.1 hypothetical protein [Octadecabacter dasysiphoniae]